MPGLPTTFDVLGRTINPAAIPLLIAGLNVRHEAIRVRALQALLKQRNAVGNQAIIRCLPEYSGEMREVLEAERGVLTPAIRQALGQSNAQMRQNAFAMVRWLEDYAQFPALLQHIDDPQYLDREQAIHAMLDLVSRLHDHLKFGTVGTTPKAGTRQALFLRNAESIRHQLLVSLETACGRFDKHRCPAVVESLLILVDANSLILKRLLREGNEALRSELEHQLLTSTHPGVLTLIFQFLTQNYPPPAAMAAFSRRTDAEFVCHLLRNWPRRLTPFQQKNLREITVIPWLSSEPPGLELIPPGLHTAALRFLLATGISEDARLAVLEWMVRQGSLDGRHAATDLLANLKDRRIQEVVLDGLTSEVPDVQAWATSQLRSREIPHAIEMLVERLDSPMPPVRDAARSELNDFNLLKVLDFHEHLEAEVGLRVGRLIQKIDPLTVDKLRAELFHPAHRRRIRAAGGSVKLGLQRLVAAELLGLLRDPDTLVRRTAVEALASIPGSYSVESIRPLLQDPSPRVRESAARALAMAGATTPELHPAQ